MFFVVHCPVVKEEPQQLGNAPATMDLLGLQQCLGLYFVKETGILGPKQNIV